MLKVIYRLLLPFGKITIHFPCALAFPTDDTTMSDVGMTSARVNV